MTTTTYTITDTSGRYLRATMREATADDVEQVLRTAADYLGVDGDIERLDGGELVLGAIVARPARPATSYDMDSDEFAARVESLMREACVAGDQDMADICAAALRGSMVARMRCAEVLRDADAEVRD